MLLSSSIAFIFLALVLSWFNWRKNRTTLFLSLLLLSLSIFGFTHTLLLEKGPMGLLAVLYNNFSPLYFLLGPLLYFYVKHTLEDRSYVRARDAWHLLPFAAAVVNVLPYWFSPFAFKMDTVAAVAAEPSLIRALHPNLYIPGSFSLAIRALLILGYVLASFVLILRHRHRPPRSGLAYRRQFGLISKWLLVLTGLVLLTDLGYLFAAGEFILEPEEHIGPDALVTPFNYFGISAFLCIPLALVLFPGILYGFPIAAHRMSAPSEDQRPGIPETSIAKTGAAEPEPIVPPQPPADETDNPFSEMAQQLLSYLDTEKPFLQPDFSADDLARAVGMPRHHLYYCLNQVLHVNFPDLRKRLRVEHAIQLLTSGQHHNLTMEGIGFSAGFSSRSSFYASFKSVCGLTPSEYLEKMGKQQDAVAAGNEDGRPAS